MAALGGKQVHTPLPREPGALPRWLCEQGVTVIVAGGMGSRAQSLLAENGIRQVVGASSSDPEVLVQALLDGCLTTGGNTCDRWGSACPSAGATLSSARWRFTPRGLTLASRPKYESRRRTGGAQPRFVPGMTGSCPPRRQRHGSIRRECSGTAVSARQDACGCPGRGCEIFRLAAAFNVQSRG
jgi:hypothetical protein